MEFSDVVRALVDHIVREETADLDRPHVVISVSATGETRVVGPFSNPFLAQCAADFEQSVERSDPDAPASTYVVTPLLGGACPHGRGSET